MADSIPSSEQHHSFWRQSRRALLRGMGVVLPSLLTVVFLLWLWNSVSSYVLKPIESFSRRVMVNRIADIHYDVPSAVAERDLQRDANNQLRSFRYENRIYVPLVSGEWIPKSVYEKVRRKPGKVFPTTAEAVYNRYVETRWLRPGAVVSVFFALFLLIIYLLGRFIAARIGAAVFAYFERLIDRLPLISTVYGTVKQVTDIVFTEAEVQYSRVVAVQYPRKGVWSIGFVTGESLPAISAAAKEPVVSVLMPTSPMPATGFTITVRKRDTIDLNLTVDQAFQFIVSCGVVAAGRSQPGDDGVKSATASPSPLPLPETAFPSDANPPSESRR